MRTFVVLVRHEVRVAARSARWRVTCLAAFVLCVIAVVSGTQRYRRDSLERATLLNAAEQEWLQQDPKAPHPANHFGRWVVKPIALLSIFDRGVEDFVGQRLVVDAHVKTPLVGSTSEEDPLGALLGGFDVAFVVSVLFPLLILFVAHDAISGEKERGTLRQILATPISRTTLILAKMVAGIVLVGFALVLPLLVSFAFPAALGVPFTSGDIASMGLMAGAAGIYCVFFLFCALAVSAATARSAASLGWLLTIWLSLVFLVPRLGEVVGAAVHPAPPPLSLSRGQVEIAKTSVVERTQRYRAVLAAIRHDHPEIPEDYGTQGHDRSARPDADWQIDPTGVFIVEANAMINRERDRLLDSTSQAGRDQEALAHTVAGLSPSVQIMAVFSSLAGTDAAHHRWFESEVQKYFEEFGRYFNDLWARNVQQLSDFSGAPSFRYRDETTKALRGRALLPSFLLLVWTAAAAIFAVVRLQKCDPR